MSEDAFKDAQINQLQTENAQLKSNVKHYTAQSHALNQTVQEYLSANINLRAGMLLLEEDVKKFKDDSKQFIARIESLELEKTKLQEEINCLQLDKTA